MQADENRRTARAMVAETRDLLAQANHHLDTTTTPDMVILETLREARHLARTAYAQATGQAPPAPRRVGARRKAAAS